MRRNRVIVAGLFAVVGAAAAALLGVGVAGAATTVACGDTITADVTLTSDLTCPSGVGLYVAEGVTVDFAGHSLDGAGSGLAGVAGGSVARNGTVRGFTAYGVTGTGTIDHMNVVRNGSGFLAGSGGPVSVIHSTIAGNAGFGVSSDLETLYIRDSVIRNNDSYGIATLNGLMMSGTTVAGNGGHGINAKPALIQLLNSWVWITDSVIRNNDLSVFTPSGDPVTLSHNSIINSSIDIDNGRVPTAAPITVTGNDFLSDTGTELGPNSIASAGTIYIANNRFVNYLLTLSPYAPFGTIVDGGGNRGNSCPPELSCTA
jgi:hypothetical protein